MGQSQSQIQKRIKKQQAIKQKRILNYDYYHRKIFHLVELHPDLFKESVYFLLKKIGKKDNYYDLDFSPNQQSVCGNANFSLKQGENYNKYLRNNYLKGNHVNFVWYRPCELYQQNNLFVEENIEPSKQPDIILYENLMDPEDIEQGWLGNNYFLSCLSIISERPSFIQRLIENDEFTTKGMYSIWFNINGEWTQIIIDDNFPCHSEKQLAFSRSRKNHLWVLLFEKAYAKAFGSYLNIEKGLSVQVFRDLTGAPCIYMELSEKPLEEIWEQLNVYKQNKFFISATKEHLQNNDGNDDLLAGQNSYAILDCLVAVNSENKNERIIKLRNPWDTKKWEGFLINSFLNIIKYQQTHFILGDWSKISHKWTPELKQKLQIEDQDEGIFWMSLEDFCKQYIRVSVCKVYEDYFYCFQKVDQSPSDNYSVFTFEITKKSHIFLSVNQYDKRHYPEDSKRNYKYSFVRMFLCKMNSNQGLSEFHQQKIDLNRNVFIEDHLEPGQLIQYIIIIYKFVDRNYLLYVGMDWVQSYQNQLVVSSYSDNKVPLQVVIYNNANHMKLIYQALKIHSSFAEFDSHCHNQIKIYKYQEDKITRYVGMAAGFCYVYYTNESKFTTLQEKNEFSEIFNLLPVQNEEDLEGKINTIIYEGYKNNEFRQETTVKPQSNQLFLMNVNLSASNGSFSFKMSSNYNVTTQLTREQVMEKALMDATKIKQRKIKGQLIQVFLHILQYPGGIGLLWLNRSGQIYCENLRLTLLNLELEDETIDQNNIIIEILNKEKYLLSLKVLDMDKPISYKLNYISQYLDEPTIQS